MPELSVQRAGHRHAVCYPTMHQWKLRQPGRGSFGGCFGKVWSNLCLHQQRRWPKRRLAAIQWWRVDWKLQGKGESHRPLRAIGWIRQDSGKALLEGPQQLGIVLGGRWIYSPSIWQPELMLHRLRGGDHISYNVRRRCRVSKRTARRFVVQRHFNQLSIHSLRVPLLTSRCPGKFRNLLTL